jgi:hypothetical protein
MTPSEYVGWAQRQTQELGLQFNGTSDVIEDMIRDGLAVNGDLFLDYGVQGNVLSREALDALIKTALEDLSVSHIFIPRRNRLARPNDPIDGIRLENALRVHGLTLVFMDATLAPFSQSKGPDIAELISAAIDYDRSRKDRRELAEKVIYAQLRLAKMGFSTGGRPPYGFRRFLVKEGGDTVRQLNEGEYVKMRGHHVLWLPGPEEEWTVIRRILQMLETTPASRVAKTLTEEGVPTPDHGRFRTDNGVRHRTSGVWGQSTVVNIARNPLLQGVVEYGRRSMGDQLRFSPEGPRELDETDYRAEEANSQEGDKPKPKVIRNSETDRISAPTQFESDVDPERHRRLLEKLNERGGTQRGKPRSRDPKKNPLGGRIFDMNCGWALYRQPYGKSFRYLCGLYQQSHGAKCSHNHVNGETAARFVLSCIQQRALTPQRLRKLEARIRQLADGEQRDNQQQQEIARKRAELAEVEPQRDQASNNLARAKTDEQYQAIATVFDQLSKQVASLQAEIVAAEARTTTANEADSAVDAAMAIIHQMTNLVREGEDLVSARQLFGLVNVRLFIGFQSVKVGKRELNKIQGGMVTFGNAPPPIDIYEGPTVRSKVKNSIVSAAIGSGETRKPSPPKVGGKDKSLGNVSRGEARWLLCAVFKSLLNPAAHRSACLC